jgi:hypothetical protein
MQRLSPWACQHAQKTAMGRKFSTVLAWTCPILLVLILFPSCFKDTITNTYRVVQPTYTSRSSVLAHINGMASRPVANPGKIFVQGNLIYLNEIDKGIHIIDNSNPSRPQPIAFLSIPGNENLAVNGNMLYADMYQDLLSIDVSDPRHVQVASTLYNLFSGRAYAYPFPTTFQDQVLTGSTSKDTTVMGGPPNPVNCNCPMPGPVFFSLASAASSAAAAPGVSGSMAMMALIGNYLYVIPEEHSLGIVSLENPRTPALLSTIPGGADLETIYPFKDKLFLGSDIGTFVFDISSPSQPVKVGEFSHGNACDPVITDGSYAYITLHSGTHCGGASNELDIVDVHNLMQPFWIMAYPMSSPKGLTKDGNTLFVCDGNSLVKVFDATDPHFLRLINEIKVSGPYDLISGNNLLMVVGDKGLYQYDYSQAKNIRLLSFLSNQ